MQSIEKTNYQNSHNNNDFHNVAEIRLFHIGLMLPLAGGRASQSYPL